MISIFIKSLLVASPNESPGYRRLLVRHKINQPAIFNSCKNLNNSQQNDSNFATIPVGVDTFSRRKIRFKVCLTVFLLIHNATAISPLDELFATNCEFLITLGLS